jgi:hypothetical protein
MIKKIELTIKRENGETEIKDVTEKFAAMTTGIFNQIKKATKDAGKGNVEKATITHIKNNISKLRREYNNLHNEGGEGYIPEDVEYWTSNPSFKEWEETEILK